MHESSVVVKEWWKRLVFKEKGIPGNVRQGRWGEDRAVKYLKDESEIRILVRNWRNPRDRRQEIDIVGLEGDALVFVEVKTRPASARVTGVDAMDRRKREALRRTCRSYLNTLPETPTTYRVDVVEVRFRRGGDRDVEIRHYRNVPLFS